MGLKYIVTGTGRCGTVYFAKLLTSLGINCGHEAIFSHSGLNNAYERMQQKRPKVSLISKLATPKLEEWFPEGVDRIQADSSYMAAPFLDSSIAHDAKIIHLVRHPLEVINSFVYGLRYFRNDCLNEDDFKDYHTFIYQHAPSILHYPDPISRAAVFYVEWNKLIESKANGKSYIRHNINSRNLKRVFSFLEMKEPSKYYNEKSNQILGLQKHITCFTQIPSLEVREAVVKMFQYYFYIKM